MAAPKDNKYHLSSKLIASIGFLLIIINTHNSFAEKVSFTKEYTYQNGQLVARDVHVPLQPANK